VVPIYVAIPVPFSIDTNTVVFAATWDAYMLLKRNMLSTAV